MSMRRVQEELLAEATGTALLVLVGPGAIMVAERTGAFGGAGVSFAFGLVVCAIIMLFGRISGAHVNPAMTIALWSARRFEPARVLPYIIAQCTGAVVAALLLRQGLGDVANVGATVPAAGVSIAGAFVIEFVASATLALVIFMVATSARLSVTASAFIIGATVGVGAYLTGPFTGGSFNPARTLGPAVASGVWTAGWVYWCAPVAGMVAGAALHSWVSGARRGEVVRFEAGE